MRALVELALAISDKEKTSESASPVVQKAMEKHRAEREESASDDIVQLLREIEETKIRKRAEIRLLKAKVSKAVSGLKDLDRRWAYAEETSNFLPVLAYFDRANSNDLSNPDEWDKLSQVPADFTPTEKE